MRMASTSAAPEIDLLDRPLLSDTMSLDIDMESDEVVLFRASFQEMEENFVKYQTFLWVLYSLALILACGIGLIMLLYLPVRRWVVRRDFQSRKLYVTRNAIVYKASPSRSQFRKSHRPYGEQLLQKLEEIGSNVKKIQSLIEERS